MYLASNVLGVGSQPKDADADADAGGSRIALLFFE